MGCWGMGMMEIAKRYFRPFKLLQKYDHECCSQSNLFYAHNKPSRNFASVFFRKRRLAHY